MFRPRSMQQPPSENFNLEWDVKVPNPNCPKVDYMGVKVQWVQR